MKEVLEINPKVGGGGLGRGSLQAQPRGGGHVPGERGRSYFRPPIRAIGRELMRWIMRLWNQRTGGGKFTLDPEKT